MTPAYVNSNGNTSAVSTTVTINVPSGISNGHLLIANVGFTGGSGITVTPPAGWTLIRRDNNGTSLGNALYWRLASSEPASYSWTLSSTQNNSGSMIAYSNVHQTVPIGADGGQSNASSTNVTAPSITTLYTDSVVLYFGGVLSVATYTPPTGYTERLDVNSASFADKVYNTAGATGTATGVATAAGVSLATQVEIHDASVNITVTPSAIVLTDNIITPTITATQNITYVATRLPILGTMPVPTFILDRVFAVSVMALAASLITPTVSTATNLTYLAAALAASGSIINPTIFGGALVSPTVQSLVSSLRQPTISGGANVAPAVMALIASERQPSVIVSAPITVTPFSLVATEFTPAVTGTAVISPSVITLSFTIPAASVVGTVVVAVNAITRTFSEPTPIISANSNVLYSALPLAAVASLRPTTVQGGSLTAAALLSAIFSERPTTVTTTSTATITPSALAGTFSIREPAIQAGNQLIVSVSAFNLAAQMVQAIVNHDSIFSVDELTALLSQPSPAFSGGSMVAPSAVPAVFNSPAPSVTTTGATTVAVNALSAIGYPRPPTIYTETSLLYNASALAGNFAVQPITFPTSSDAIFEVNVLVLSAITTLFAVRTQAPKMYYVVHARRRRMISY